MTRAPPSPMAPKPYSGWNGTPSLRTTITSRGARSSRATSAATGTPPCGKASTTTSVPRRCDSDRASRRPASARSANSIALPPHIWVRPGWAADSFPGWLDELTEVQGQHVERLVESAAGHVAAHHPGHQAGCPRHLRLADAGVPREAERVFAGAELGRHLAGTPAAVEHSAQQLRKLRGEIRRDLHREPVTQGVQPGPRDPVGALPVPGAELARDPGQPGTRLVHALVQAAASGD